MHAVQGIQAHFNNGPTSSRPSITEIQAHFIELLLPSILILRACCPKKQFLGPGSATQDMSKRFSEKKSIEEKERRQGNVNSSG